MIDNVEKSRVDQRILKNLDIELDNSIPVQLKPKPKVIKEKIKEKNENYDSFDDSDAPKPLHKKKTLQGLNVNK